MTRSSVMQHIGDKYNQLVPSLLQDWPKMATITVVAELSTSKCRANGDKGKPMPRMCDFFV